MSRDAVDSASRTGGVRTTRRTALRALGGAFAGVAVARPAIAAVPALAHAQGATPAATGEPAGLEAMLARLPASLPELDDPSQAYVAFADIAAQLGAVGITPPERRDAEGFDAWAAATRALPLPSSADPFGVYEREDYGFDLLQADQTLTIKLPPFSLALLRGRFDDAAILGALRTAGYRPVEVGGHELLSLRGDFEPDRGAARAFQMADMNFAAVLADGTLAFASAGAPLAAVLDVAAGAVASMLEGPGVRALVAQAPPDLASALLVPGTALAAGVPTSLVGVGAVGTPDIGAIATEIAATSAMPPVVLALLVATVGGPLEIDDAPVDLPPGTPDARAVAVLLMPDPEAAEAAVPVVEERLATGVSAQTGEPYAALFPERSVAAVPDAPVLVVDLALGPDVSPRILVNLLLSRDLGFLAW